jgi:hypothetical protein
MSGPDLEALAGLLQALESEDRSKPSVSWLIDGGEFPDDLELEEALLVIEAAKRMALASHLSLAKKASDKRVKKAAATAIHSLKTQGHDVPVEDNGADWSLGSETREIPPPVSLLGMPQGDGYFPFILLCHGTEGASVSAGVAGSGQGFQDADHARVGRSKARQIVEGARKDHNLVEVPFHVALHFCERAFDEGGGQRPHGWSHLLSSVPEGTLNTARMVDPLCRQEADLDGSKLAAVDSLLEGEHRVVFNLEERISGPAVDSVMEVLSSQISVDDDDKMRRVAREVAAAVDEAFEGHARQTWTLALDVLSVISEVAGWEEERVAARHTALALRSGRKGSDIPFFRIWTERQLAAVSEMILAVRAGREFPSQ